MIYPREYHWFVSRVLQEHPERERELRDLEEAIVACCHAPSVSDGMPRSEGDAASEPERVVEAKERNSTYQRLNLQVSKVRAALKTLSDQELEQVDVLFWSGVKAWEAIDILSTDAKGVWRVKTRILHKVAPFVLGEWTKSGAAI